MFFGFTVVYALRVNLSVAMVAMVNTTDPRPAENGSLIPACPVTPGTDNSSDAFQQPEGVTVFLFFLLLNLKHETFFPGHLSLWIFNINQV